MKNAKKIVLVLVCIMMIGMFGGCGTKSDKSASKKDTAEDSYKTDLKDTSKDSVKTDLRDIFSKSDSTESKKADSKKDEPDSSHKKDTTDLDTKETDKVDNNDKTEFDAVAYLKANLDNSYKNDATALVNLGIATAEEAEAVYRQGIDVEMASFMSGISISEELEQEMTEVFEELFSKVKYSVDKAEKKADGSYEVTVTYEQMQVFGPMMEDYLESVSNLMEDTALLSLSEAEQMERLIKEIEKSLKKVLENVQYAAPAETTVTINIKNNIYTPDPQDLLHLENVLFDMDQV